MALGQNIAYLFRASYRSARVLLERGCHFTVGRRSQPIPRRRRARDDLHSTLADQRVHPQAGSTVTPTQPEDVSQFVKRRTVTTELPQRRDGALKRALARTWRPSPTPWRTPTVARVGVLPMH